MELDKGDRYMKDYMFFRIFSVIFNYWSEILCLSRRGVCKDLDKSDLLSQELKF